MIIDKSLLDLSHFLTKSISNCENDFDISKLVCEQYNNSHKFWLSYIGKKNVIACHKFYLDNKLNFHNTIKFNFTFKADFSQLLNSI